MTTAGRIRNLGLALALAIAGGTAGPTAAGAGSAPERDATAASGAYLSADLRDDPRLHRTGGAERALRRAGDLVFSRPIHLVRLVAGVAIFPVALPVAAVFADWRDAVDSCVSGPFGMVFQRPLGE